MKGRKYERYEVKVQYRDGSVEYIRYNGVNTSNYKDMIKVYKDTKETHENDGKVESISFVGISSTGELNVFWQKNIDIPCDDINKDCREVVREILDRVELLKSQKSYHSKMVHKYERQRDIIYHMIENSNNNQFDDLQNEIDYKVDMFNKLNQVAQMRRNSKDHVADLGNIINELSKIDITGWGNNRKNYTKTSDEYSKRMNVEKYYSNDSEKEKLIKEYRSKYSNYIDDEFNKSIYFYNTVYKNNKNKQKEDKISKKLTKNSGRIA